MTSNDTVQGSVLGIDLGSRNVKICLMRDGVIASLRQEESVGFYRRHGIRGASGFSLDLTSLGFDPDVRIAATGYGRMSAALVGATQLSELRAHLLGACHQTGWRDFILVDIGGQDYKVVRATDGMMTDMATNDKCAAATGRYLETMAATLGLTLDELGGYADDPVELSNTCAIFGESELIGHLVRGEEIGRLAAGVNRAVVERIAPLIERMGEGNLVLAGGVALNRAVASLLADRTGRPVSVLPDPVHNGAIGCCLSLWG